MTEEKAAILQFLDLAADYLLDGHARPRDYAIDAEPVNSIEGGAEEAALPPGLPLAYLIEEDEESVYSAESDSLEDIAADIAACRGCGLATGRTLPVPGEGASRPLAMVIGEGPGKDEDASGRPFVGRAGQLLDKMLESIGLSRGKNCYIANMVKCRPPGNRDPEPGEIAACFPYLERQIMLLRPRAILCAGRVAAQSLLKTSTGINKLRGEFLELRIGEADSGEMPIPLLCTFHPSAILRDESLKRPAWEDLKLLKSRLDSLDEE